LHSLMPVGFLIRLEGCGKIVTGWLRRSCAINCTKDLAIDF
jgi:hypothetical protein